VGRNRRLVIWLPRVLAIGFAGFVGLFALDVLDAGYGPREMVLALLIHLIPTFGMLLATALAWRRPWIGAVAFAAWATWYLMAFWGRFPPSVFVVMSGVPLMVGILFLLSWRGHQPR
jgi:hypothetical protein